MHGHGWSDQSVATPRTLRAVWGTSATNIWASGLVGELWHFNGSSWSSTTANTNQGLYAIWGTAADNVYLAASDIHHYDGLDWSEHASLSGLYYAIWGRSADEIYAIGSMGQLHEFDGISWSFVNLNNSTFTGLGGSANHVFTVGLHNFVSPIWLCKGSDTFQMQAYSGATLYGVTHVPGLGYLAVGEAGTIRRYPE